MGRIAWGATTPRVWLGSVAIGQRLWRSRAVEKSQSRLSHRAWKSRPKRGIPTSPQPRRRRVINSQPDNSLTTKTGPFNLLRTAEGFAALRSVRRERCIQEWHDFIPHLTRGPAKTRCAITEAARI